MSKSNVEMSLDDIIKANKSKDKGTVKKNRGSNLSSKGVVKRGRKGPKQPQNNGVRKANGPKAVGKRVLNKSNKAVSTVATKKLVQKLVKKALAQTNVARVGPVRNVALARRNVQRPKFRGARAVKKTVVLKMNPRSRVISRRPRANVQEIIATRGRGPVRFNQNVVVSAVPRRRINYVPNVVTRPVMVRAVPKRVVQQRAQPVYQMVNVAGNRPSIRDHISRLRTSRPVNVIQVPQVVYRRQQRPQQQQQRRQNFQPQRPRFINQQRPAVRQQRQQNNFSGNRQFKNDPFFEPPNFLQRIPIQVEGRRY